MHQSQLISKIPHILKEMYDADLLEEEVILGWAEKVKGSMECTVAIKYLKVACWHLASSFWCSLGSEKPPSQKWAVEGSA